MSSDENGRLLQPHDGHFRVLILCMSLSVVLLIISRVGIDLSGNALPPWISVIASIAPLVYYHLGYLRPIAHKGLSQAAVDSVYYYGFLITIVALGMSALSMVSPAGATELTDPGAVISQFGVGLLATGYAIVARLHLSSQSPLGDVSPDVVIDNYVARSRLMVEHLDLTLRSFDALAQKCTKAAEKIEMTANEAVKHNGSAILGQMAIFDTQMKEILADTKEGIVEIRGMVSDTAFLSERKAFAKSMKAIADGTNKLNEELVSLGSSSRDASATISAAAIANERFAETLGDIHGRSVALNSATDAYVASLKLAQIEVGKSTLQLKEQVAETAKELSNDVQRATGAASLLVAKIIEIAEIVIERTGRNNPETRA